MKDGRLTRERIGMIFLSVLLATVITMVMIDEEQEARRVQAQEKLAQEVLRFHILANSDREKDQTLKLEVRDCILDWLGENLTDDLDVSETKLWLRNHSEEIVTLCEKKILSQGYDYPVSVAVTTCYFPEKCYGDMTFPAGNYEALRVEIGEAKGHNWWCVLYPNLCFLDAVRAVVPEESKQQLRQVLSEDTYDVCHQDADVRIKSYFLKYLFGDE